MAHNHPLTGKHRPQGRRRQRSLHEHSGQRVSESTLRILVVDDDEVDLEAVRRCLEDFDDVELTFASDGATAMAHVENAAPDLVLTDLRMPRVDGLELVEQLHEEYPLIPVVLMTARGSEQIAVAALEAGASSYVPKHLLAEELEETIEQVLEVAESRQAQRELMQFLGSRETRFELDGDITLIMPLVTYFQESLERLDFGDESTRTQIGMALSEGISNAILRGNLEVGSELRANDRDAYDALIRERAAQEPYSLRRVTVTATESTEVVRYVIRDEGPGFDPAVLPDPTSAKTSSPSAAAASC